MKAKKFELFMCCLGNGVTLCNKAVEERGDYKTIGHVSNAGNIKLYVERDYIPDVDMRRIEKLATSAHDRFLSRLEAGIRRNPLDVYCKMLEALPLSEYMAFMNLHRESGYRKAIWDLVPVYVAVS
jgi:hypothetical protein